MINYEKCIECGACVDHCTHGVYNEDKAPRPVVVKPEECVQGCTGCSKKCQVEAITYFGQEANMDGADCGCSSDSGCGCGTEKEEKKESGCGCGGCCG